MDAAITWATGHSATSQSPGFRSSHSLSNIAVGGLLLEDWQAPRMRRDSLASTRGTCTSNRLRFCSHVDVLNRSIAKSQSDECLGFSGEFGQIIYIGRPLHTNSILDQPPSDRARRNESIPSIP
jgi:hypothetical protein